MTMKARKYFLMSGAFILIFLLLILSSSLRVRADSEVKAESNERPGEITVDKYRDKYALYPGEKTKVTLDVKINPIESTKPIMAVLALDMSGSMAENDSLDATLAGAKQAARLITQNNVLETQSQSYSATNANVALVRYDSAASVYDFTDKKWLLLDDQESIETLAKEHCYSANIDKIEEALGVNMIASSVRGGPGYARIHNYPRKNNYYVTTDVVSYSGFPNAIDKLTIKGYTTYNDPAILTYKAGEDFRTYNSELKQNLVKGTNMEAGILVTDFVASKITDSDVYPIFMTDGVPTYYQFDGTISNTAYTSAAQSVITNFRADGLKVAAFANRWVSGMKNSLPDPQDPARKLAVAAGNRLQDKITDPNSRIQNVFAIGVNKGFTQSSNLGQAQGDILYALTGDRGSSKGGLNGRSYLTDNPEKEITEIYESIIASFFSGPVTSPITIRDEVPSGFTLTNETRKEMEKYAKSLGGSVSFNPIADGGVTIIWQLGGLIPDKPLQLTYDLVVNDGSYGILNTNHSATLTYDTFCPDEPEYQDQDPNTQPVVFPKPQVKVHPDGGQDDHYVMPDNRTPYELNSDLVGKRDVVGLVPKEGQSIATGDMIYQNDQLPSLVDDGAVGGYDERDDPRPIDKIKEADRNVKPLKVVILPSQDGPVGVEQQHESGILDISIPDTSEPTKVNLRYTPNPNRDPDRGYQVSYFYRYESIEDDGQEPAYVTQWYIITIDVPPKQNKASIEFKKVGDNGAALKGAEFGLYIDRGDGQVGDSQKPIETTLTDGAGMGYFSNLLKGNYLIKEIKAPAEYLLDETCYPVVISQTQQDSSAVVRPTTYPFVNKLKVGSIAFNKVDQYGSPIAGVRFGLYQASDREFTLPLAEATSGADGKVLFKDVKPGKYRVKELEAPANYENKYWVSDEIEITSLNNQLQITLDDVVNVLIQSFDLEVTKIGSDGERLPGAGFSLKNDVTNQLYQAMSGEQGTFTILDLDPGIYYLKEIEAPAGYRLLTSEYLLDIKLLERNVTLNGKPVDFEWVPGTTNRKPVLKLTIVNKRMPELPKTGGIGSLIFLGAGSIFMGVGFHTINKLNRKQQRREQE